jgi:cytochrome c biogenesis protein ResB
LIIWLVVIAAALVALLIRPYRRWISSMSGAVWILAVIAVLTLAGVLIGQKLPAEAYTDRYGEGLGAFIMSAGLSDVFSSWYFLLLVSALGVSLIACSAGRLWKLARAAGRQRARRVGSLTLHASLVLVLLGGVVTASLGFRYPGGEYLAAGESMFVPEADFTVRVDAASTEFTTEGMVKEYFSDVTVIDHGENVMTRRIEVNHPLVYKGIGVYQYEMLPSATSVEAVLLGISMAGPEGNGALRRLMVPYDESYRIPGTDVSLKVVEFLSDFTYDIERHTAELASAMHTNPAVLVQVSRADSVIGERWVFADIQTHRNDEGLPCRIFLLDYVPDFEHGLTRFEISHQPGTPLLYLGFVAMSVGLVLAFWTGGAEPREGRKAKNGEGGGG